MNTTSWLPLVTRALVVGVLGGAGLVLTQVYTAPGGAPWWGFPLILLTIVVASAAVAYVSS